MKPFQKIYKFGFMTVIHPSGHTDKVTVDKLETELKTINESMKALKVEREICLIDITQISSKSKIKRIFIKHRIKKKAAQNDNETIDMASDN